MVSAVADSASWATLHGATLVDLELSWASGTMRVHLRPRGTVGKAAKIEATRLVSLQCPRRFPWGDSLEVCEIHGPVETNEGSQIEMQMQSGDLIIMLAQSFDLSVPTTK